MGKVINLFMWGYQGHFRVCMEGKAQRILQDLAPGLDPQALLIGVQAPDATDEEKRHPPVCVEPEDEEWDPAIFAGCARRTEDIYTDHPDHRILYGDEPRMRDKPENIRKKSAYAAVREVFDAYDQAHETRTFCGFPAKLHGYYVIPALQFNRAQLDEYPSLPAPVEFREFKLSGSFLDFVIQQLLYEARRALGTQEPGRFFGVLDDDSETILRKAGDEFCSVLLLATQDLMFQNAFRDLNFVSAMRYEGAPGSGTLVFTSRDHSAVDLKVEFSRGVPLGEPRWARKILEMSERDLCCICTGADGIRGLGTIADEHADGVFVVEFTGHFKWQLAHKGKVLVQSSYGVPRLPRVVLKEATFKSTFRRLFPGVGGEDEDRLWSIVDTATRQRHGTMIVVSDRAEEESKRLRHQSTPIKPVPLTSNLVERVSGIDGAILVDRFGTCHAIGVILDGMATKEGNAARGARYNSAVRYHSTRGDVPTLLVVVSEDGGADVIPTLRPQVSRSLIERKIARLKQCNIDNYAKIRNWLRDHSFYLSAEQCRAVNDEIARIEGVPLQPNELRVGTAQLVPNPEMDESYYLPESSP